MVGLGRMGAGLAERLRRAGHEVIGYDRDPAVSEVASLADLVGKLAPPRVLWVNVAATARIENWRWAGVPFYLRTGKRLPRRTTEVTIAFRDAPAPVFETAGVCAPEADHLVIRIQPEEGTSFAFQAKQPGPGFTPATVRMDFSYGAGALRTPPLRLTAGTCPTAEKPRGALDRDRPVSDLGDTRVIRRDADDPDHRVTNVDRDLLGVTHPKDPQRRADRLE